MDDGILNDLTEREVARMLMIMANQLALVLQLQQSGLGKQDSLTCLRISTFVMEEIIRQHGQGLSEEEAQKASEAISPRLTPVVMQMIADELKAGRK